MARPQLEDGHTRIANEILEHLMKVHLSSNQWQVLLCIIRKTYGYQKKVDYIANFQIGEATHLGKTVVSRILRNLEDMKLILRKGKHIGFQKDWEQWQGLAKQSTLGTKLAEQLTIKKLAEQPTKLAGQLTELAKQPTKVSSPEDAQKKKETIPKGTIPKKEIFILPEWIDKDTWGAFLEMRKKKNAVPTERAKQLLVKELEKLRSEGYDPNEVLNQSIMRNYTGVFPLKGGQDGTYQRGPKKTTNEQRRASIG